MSGKRSQPTMSNNGDDCTARKQRYLSFAEVFGSSSDEEDDRRNHSDCKNDDSLAIALLDKMEKAKMRSTTTFSNFRFDKLKLRGIDDLRVYYEKMRKRALGNMRRLSLKDEIPLVREFYWHDKPVSTTIKEKRVEEAKKKKDDGDDEPKRRPMTSFFRFHGEYIAKHPEIRSRERTRLASEIWRSMSDVMKKPYVDAYYRELRDYENPKYRHRASSSKSATTSAVGVKKHGSPMPPPPKTTAFDLFRAAKSRGYSKKYEARGLHLQKKLAVGFEKLSQGKRAKWTERARVIAKKQYEKSEVSSNGNDRKVSARYHVDGRKGDQTKKKVKKAISTVKYFGTTKKRSG